MHHTIPQEPAGTAAIPPLETEAQARALPAVRVIHQGAAGPGPVRMDAGNARLITQACDGAGVELGAYDRRIVAWLAGLEPQMCAAIAGMIGRAAGDAPPLSRDLSGDLLAIPANRIPGPAAVASLHAAQLATLGQALADAIEYRQPSGACTDCDVHPAGLCPPHAANLDRADDYAALARDLGIEGDR